MLPRLVVPRIGETRAVCAGFACAALAYAGYAFAPSTLVFYAWMIVFALGGIAQPALNAILSRWPVERPKDWLRRVNTPLSARELRRLRISIERGQPYGEDEWVERTAQELGLEHTIRPEGRPPKRSDPGGRAKS